MAQFKNQNFEFKSWKKKKKDPEKSLAYFLNFKRETNLNK